MFGIREKIRKAIDEYDKDLVCCSECGVRLQKEKAKTEARLVYYTLFPLFSGKVCSEEKPLVYDDVEAKTFYFCQRCWDEEESSTEKEGSPEIVGEEDTCVMCGGSLPEGRRRKYCSDECSERGEAFYNDAYGTGYRTGYKDAKEGRKRQR